MPPYRQRKSPRHPDADYSQSGAYFVTICTHNRAHLFGEIRDGEMTPNANGYVAAACWYAIPNHYPDVELDAFVVMPNHVHGIIVITDAPTKRQRNAQGESVTNSSDENRTGHALSLPKTKPSLLGNVVGSYKSGVTRTIRRTERARICRGDACVVHLGRPFAKTKQL